MKLLVIIWSAEDRSCLHGPSTAWLAATRSSLHYLGQEGQIRNGAVGVEIIWTKGRFLEASSNVGCN